MEGERNPSTLDGRHPPQPWKRLFAQTREDARADAACPYQHADHGDDYPHAAAHADRTDAVHPNWADAVCPYTIGGVGPPVPEGTIHVCCRIPTAPDQVVVYQQLQSEPITVDLARQTAASLGVSGDVVEYMGEGGWPIYEVHGGGSVVRFLGYADQFMYEVTPSIEVSNSTQLFSFEQQVAIAEDFLRQKGLLEGDYHVEPIQSDPGVVRFVQQLDEHEVRYGVGENRMGSTLQWIEVSVTADGAVATVAYNAHSFQQVGKFPILTAQQAWERFSASPTGNYGMYAVVAAEQPVTYRSWTRDYPAGTVHIYDYAVSLQSAEGGAPVVQFSRFPLIGNVQDMETGKFLHAWGQITLDDQGHKTFQVEGWERSTLEDNYLSGTIQRAGDSAILQTEDGQWLAIPDLPADVPEGERVNVRGVILNGSLDWSYIDTGEISRILWLIRCPAAVGEAAAAKPHRPTLAVVPWPGWSWAAWDLFRLSQQRHTSQEIRWMA